VRLAVLFHVLPAALLGALFACVGVVHVTSRVMVVGSGYRLSTLEQDNQRLSRESDRLRLELATLQNPGRLERLAHDQLGMAAPAPGSVWTIKAQPPEPRRTVGGVAVARRPRAEEK
jgi:cell division protein FtsL